MTLDRHIELMRGCATAAINMVRLGDQQEMAGTVIEDIVVKTLTMVRDNPAWPNEAWKRAVIHSPTPRIATPPLKKRRKRHTPQQGSGESPVKYEREISLDDIKV